MCIYEIPFSRTLVGTVFFCFNIDKWLAVWYTTNRIYIISENPRDSPENDCLIG